MMRTGLVLILYFFSLLPFKNGFTQTVSYPARDWINQLNDPSNNGNLACAEINEQLTKLDSAVQLNMIEQLEPGYKSGNPYFQSRFLSLKAFALQRAGKANQKSGIHPAAEQALRIAYELDDEQLMLTVSWIYCQVLFHLQEMETAAVHCMNVLDLLEKLEIKNLDQYWFLGELIFYTRNYHTAVGFLKKVIYNWKDTTVKNKFYLMKSWNTAGQAYQQLGQLDSALIFYNKSLELAYQLNNAIWKGINSSGMGQILFLQKHFDQAKPLLQFDYETCKAAGVWEHAANSLQWLAAINNLESKNQLALKQLNEAEELLRLSPRVEYLKNVYQSKADAWEALNRKDSFAYYNSLYLHMHDSLERFSARSSLDIAQMRLVNQKNNYTIKLLNQEKETEKQKRNFFIIIILLLAAIALMLVNRQRQKFKYLQHLALQQKQAADAEIAAAKTQLQLFTQNIKEKTATIQKLEEQAKLQADTAHHLELLEELKDQTILTEDDWEKFKTLFEKIYPGYFTRLKMKVPDITVAEQRMAALVYLQLTSKQMASILGISLDSVHKSRQRLRHRIGLSTEIKIEDYLTSI